jgi:carbon monoxide dehydrogenase subunit G
MVRPSGRRLASCAEVEFLVGGEGEGEGVAWIRARIDLDAGGRVA